MEFTNLGKPRCQCGKVMKGVLRKSKCVYHHCMGERREESGRWDISKAKITEAFSDVLKRLTVPKQMFGWIEEGFNEASSDRYLKRAKCDRAIL